MVTLLKLTGKGSGSG